MPKYSRIFKQASFAYRLMMSSSSESTNDSTIDEFEGSKLDPQANSLKVSVISEKSQAENEDYKLDAKPPVFKEKTEFPLKMALKRRISLQYLENHMVYRLNKRLKEVLSEVKSIGRFAVDDQPQPLAVDTCDASERNLEHTAEVGSNALVPIADGQEERPLATTFVQKVINLVSRLIGSHIYTCLLVLFLIVIVLLFYKDEIWGPSTAEGRYQAKMQNSGPGLKILIFLLHQFDENFF
ncbi:uncharacterized protein LOC108151511 isoform X1 [Drosophila miranda]|uniref:uncharacterized protein LOC108151511 isoform X1 n=1 Tax=Drosophila miranda TaxID=7229 RepID=UPI0007E8953B|nr:uncharacterized protein LOC108151511 isoform X1 [Drosophila miranda]